MYFSKVVVNEFASTLYREPRNVSARSVCRRVVLCAKAKQDNEVQERRRGPELPYSVLQLLIKNELRVAKLLKTDGKVQTGPLLEGTPASTARLDFTLFQKQSDLGFHETAGG